MLGCLPKETEGPVQVLYEAIKEMHGRELADSLRDHLPLMVKEGYRDERDLRNPVAFDEVLVEGNDPFCNCH